jgi:hypothetical protein
MYFVKKNISVGFLGPVIIVNFVSSEKQLRLVHTFPNQSMDFPSISLWFKSSTFVYVSSLEIISSNKFRQQ